MENNVRSFGKQLLKGEAIQPVAYPENHIEIYNIFFYSLLIIKKCIKLNSNLANFVGTTRERSQVLDITLSTPSIKDIVTNWRVLSEPSLSDHKAPKQTESSRG